MDIEEINKSLELPEEKQDYEKFRFRETFDENYEGLLRHRSEFLVQELNGRLPSQVELILLSEKYGIDVASYVFYQSILRSKKHNRFIKEVNKETQTYLKKTPYRVVLCEGNYPFVQNKKFKENFLKYKIEDAGYEVTNLNFDYRYTLFQNAENLYNCLMEESNKPVLLISFGLGGAMANVLNSHPNYHKKLNHVKVWLNISGALNGLQILKEKFSNPWSSGLFRARVLLKNHHVNIKCLQQLSRDFPVWGMDPSYSMWKPQLVSIIGIPLRKHLKGEFKGKFNKLSEFGPNDGINVISDISFRKGLIYPVWGGGFLLNSSFFEYKFRKILCFLSRGVKF